MLNHKQTQKYEKVSQKCVWMITSTFFETVCLVSDFQDQLVILGPLGVKRLKVINFCNGYPTF